MTHGFNVIFTFTPQQKEHINCRSEKKGLFTSVCLRSHYKRLFDSDNVLKVDIQESDTRICTDKNK